MRTGLRGSAIQIARLLYGTKRWTPLPMTLRRSPQNQSLLNERKKLECKSFRIGFG